MAAILCGYMSLKPGAYWKKRIGDRAQMDPSKMAKVELPILSTAWYNKKSEATFSDILAFVRRSIWAENYFNDSSFEADSLKIKPEQWESLLDQLARAA